MELGFAGWNDIKMNMTHKLINVGLEDACMRVHGYLFSRKLLRLEGKEDRYPNTENKESRNRMFGVHKGR